jgi:hypothetical protein
MVNQPKDPLNKSGASKAISSGMISLPGEMSEETKQMAIRYQFIYSTLGLSLGLMCMILGTLLFFNGIGGSTSWTAKIMGADSKISDAAPGALLFSVGLFSVSITRFGIKIQK